MMRLIIILFFVSVFNESFAADPFISRVSFEDQAKKHFSREIDTNALRTLLEWPLRKPPKAYEGVNPVLEDCYYSPSCLQKPQIEKTMDNLYYTSDFIGYQDDYNDIDNKTWANYLLWGLFTNAPTEMSFSENANAMSAQQIQPWAFETTPDDFLLGENLLAKYDDRSNHLTRYISPILTGRVCPKKVNTNAPRGYKDLKLRFTMDTTGGSIFQRVRIFNDGRVEIVEYPSSIGGNHTRRTVKGRMSDGKLTLETEIQPEYSLRGAKIYYENGTIHQSRIAQFPDERRIKFQQKIEQHLIMCKRQLELEEVANNKMKKCGELRADINTYVNREKNEVTERLYYFYIDGEYLSRKARTTDRAKRAIDCRLKVMKEHTEALINSEEGRVVAQTVKQMFPNFSTASPSVSKEGNKEKVEINQ